MLDIFGGELFVTASDDTATSTFGNNYLRLNASADYASGTLYIDNEGNIYTSGTIYGSISLSGDLLPSAHNTYNLGSYDYAWKDIYASGTMYGKTFNDDNLDGVSTSTFQGLHISKGTVSPKDLVTIKPISSGDGVTITESDSDNNAIVFNGSATGGTWYLYSSGASQHYFTTTALVFNERGVTGTSVRMESDNDNELFYLDGTNDKIGISTQYPSEMLTIYGGNLAVGDGTATSTITANSTATSATSTFASNIYAEGGLGIGDITFLVGAGIGTSTIYSDLLIHNVVPASNGNNSSLGLMGTNPWGNIYSSGTMYIGSIYVGGDIIPNVDDTYSLGSATYQFDNLYIDGTAFIDFFSGDILPVSSSVYDLGSDTYEFMDLWIDGTAYIDTLSLENDLADADIVDALTISSSGSVDSTALTDGGTISFDWTDGEVANDLTIAGGNISSNTVYGTWTVSANLTFSAGVLDVVVDSAYWDVDASGYGSFNMTSAGSAYAYVCTVNATEGVKRLYLGDANDCSVSASRFKEDIRPQIGGLSTIMNIEPIIFKYKEDETDTDHLGFIAEDVEAADPTLAVYVDGLIHNYDTKGLTSVIVKAIQEQQGMINDILGTYATSSGMFHIDEFGNISTGGTLFVDGAGTSTFGGNVLIGGELMVAGNCTEIDGACADIAESYASRDMVEPGDVVIASAPVSDSENPEAKTAAIEKSKSAYSKKIAGVVTSNPGIVMSESGISMSGTKWGSAFKPNVALAGRVPVKVSTENGPIEVGDLLVSASEPGYAMKWNTDICKDDNGLMTEVCKTMKNVAVIGTALEAFGEESDEEIKYGKTMAVLRSGFVSQDYGTASSDILLGTGVDAEGNLIVASAIKSEAVITKSITSTDNKWKIDEDGNFTTRGLVKTEIETTNSSTTLYGVNSPDAEIMLSGSAELFNGEARIVFEEPLQEIVSEIVPIRVSITPTSPSAGSIYVTEKTNGGFKIMKADTGGNYAGTFDWIVVARRKGFERQSEVDDFNAETGENVEPPPIIPEEPETEPVVDVSLETPISEPLPEEPPAEVPAEEPVVEELPAEEPETESESTSNETPSEIQ
jgi:hypothetical protein